MRSLLVVIALVHAAHADVDIDPCLGDSHDAIRRAVGVELGDGSAVHATIACDGPVIVLRADDPATGAPLVRRLDVGLAMGPMGPRLIALALVELIGDRAPPPALPEVREPPLAAIVARSEPATARPRVSVIAGVLRFRDDPYAVPGVDIRFATQSRFGVMIDAQLHDQVRRTMVGEVGLDIVDVGAAAIVHLAFERGSVDLGAGLRGGAVRLSGSPGPVPARDTTFWTRWAGLLATAELAVPITPRLAFAAAIETGYVVAPVVGVVDQKPVVRVDGAWVAAHLGLLVHL